MIDLTGQTALVTGSTQGIGAAIAKSLAKAGATVLIHGLTEDHHARDTLAACRAFTPGSKLLCCDLCDSFSAIDQTLVAQALSQFPRLNLLVNNAGTFIDKPFLEMDESTYDRTLQLNLKTPYFLAQAFAKSINGLLAEPDHTAYDASKAAIAGLVRSLCVALAPHGIRVNALAPGLVRTPLTNQVLASDKSALAWMELHTPNGQVPEADVCGPMAAFLLSDLAEHIHGQTIYIDGGMSAWQQPDVPTQFRNSPQSSS